LPTQVYYRLGKVQKTYKYEYQEVVEKIMEFKTYGPWEEELLNNEY
jgi:hypothetical protein